MSVQNRSEESLSILIVDDNDDAVEMMSLLLETYGHRTVGAADALEAIRLAGELRPDIVLLDIGLPGMDGFEVCRRMRQALPRSQTCIVAITGWTASDKRATAIEAGFDDYLVKPVDVEVVLKALETCRSATAPATVR